MKIAVLVSGGVDSSVALAKLVEQGHQVTAFYLKIWLEDELSFLGSCPWEEDLSYVTAVCEQFKAPLRVLPFQQAYWDRVVTYTLAEVAQGRTPNPDIFCNTSIKFGAFLETLEPEFEKVATGHYAQVSFKDSLYHLFASPDPVKDQTYFLCYLTQEQLGRSLFPIGHLTKREVREEAERLNLPNKNRPDSQGICFLGKLKFTDFIKFHLGEQPGDLVEYETGNKIGTHQGFWFYTVGQRKGIGLAGGPWYVVAKEPATNRVFISRSYHAPSMIRNECIITSCNWITGNAPIGEQLEVKLRHGPQRYPAIITPLSGTDFRVTLQGNDQGIAAGQFAVAYQGSECLGGGVIKEGVA